MDNLLKFFKPKGQESSLSKFTQETGISQITDLESLEKFLNFLLPEKYYGVTYFEPLKYFEIKGTDYHDNNTTSIRISGEGNKLKFFVHDTYQGDDEEKIFDYHKISDMEAWLKKNVNKYLPTYGPFHL